jgi:hypothetical protein
MPKVENEHLTKKETPLIDDKSPLTGTLRGNLETLKLFEGLDHRAVEDMAQSLEWIDLAEGTSPVQERGCRRGHVCSPGWPAPGILHGRRMRAGHGRANGAGLLGRGDRPPHFDLCEALCYKRNPET